jgi:hypothetical protein
MPTLARSRTAIILAHLSAKVEMFDGEVREKHPMTIPHKLAQVRLARTESTFILPDGCIIPSPGNQATR